MRYAVLVAVALVLLAGCAAVREMTPPVSSDWRVMATEADRERLRDWRSTFSEALARSRAAGFGAKIDAEGALLQPDATLGGALPSGTYRCRTFKIGARNPSDQAFGIYGPVPCEVVDAGSVQRFAVSDAAQRPSGFIYPGDRLHGVFLGALSLGDEKASMRYAVDPLRDMAGWVDRVGDKRWRIVLPDPHFESLTDVIELIPAAGG